MRLFKTFMKNFKNIFQFKITLNDIKPTIWRRIQVPEIYTFWDFHVSIQDAMGWYDCHLHDFEIGKSRTPDEKHFGIPDPYGDDFREILLDWEYYIKDYFYIGRNIQAKYWYDFGDDWRHVIILEKVLPAISDISYPRCTDGKRACPPEDCGGVPGYYHFLEAMSNPKHEDYKDLFEWFGGKYDPEYFDSGDIKFDDPAKRLKKLLKQQAAI